MKNETCNCGLLCCETVNARNKDNQFVLASLPYAVDALEPSLDLGGIDLGTLNLAQTIINRTNMGGIAGASTGIISGCLCGIVEGVIIIRCNLVLGICSGFGRCFLGASGIPGIFGISGISGFLVFGGIFG